MRRILLIIVLTILLILNLLALLPEVDTAKLSRAIAPAPVVAAESLPIAVLPLAQPVTAEAVVKPAHAASLGLPIDGIVGVILVQEGEQVAAGQLLLHLDNNRQVVGIAQATATLERATAYLQTLQNGARSEEIDAAQAVVDKVQAQLAQLQEGARTADEAAAAAALTAAQANLQNLLNGPQNEALIAARADMANAQAAVQRAQRAYDQVKWRNDIGMLPESLELQQATNNFEAANARYELLTRGANSADLAGARARIESARAELERVRAPARQSAIAAVEAELRQAQAQLALLQAGSRSETIAMAQADVATAQAALLQAQIGLAETELKAPFAGVVAFLDAAVGEPLAAGVPMIQLGDLSAWQIETTDLVERDVANVQVGSRAAITFAALPDVTLTGKVTSIRRIGESKAGDVTYTAIITPDRHEARLAWNMTAIVNIDK